MLHLLKLAVLLCSKTVRLLPTAAAASTAIWHGFSAYLRDTRASDTNHVHAVAKNSIKGTFLLIAAYLTALEIFFILMDPCIVDDSVEIQTRCRFVIEFIIPKFFEGST
jgi:hypothetical protein